MMDQATPTQDVDDREPPRSHRRAASVWLAGAFLIPSLAIGGFLIGVHFGRTSIPIWLQSGIVQGPATEPSPAADALVLYYRDPDGKPVYSLQPKNTEDGRRFRPVYASEDVTFGGTTSQPQALGTSTGGKRILYYRNPMGLPDVSPVPKKDSMGMDYIPVYEEEVADSSTIVISPGKLQRTGYRSEVVERRVVSRPIRVPGTIQLDERRISVVATRSESFIDKVENVTTGDRVRKDQPLLRLYSPEINAASAQLISNPGFEGSRRRLQNLNVPDEVIAEMEHTRKVPLSIQWTSPRDGVVLERNAVDGMRAAAGDVLFRIADLSVMWVLADVPEHAIGQVHPGQTVAVQVRSLPGRTFMGRIALIYPQVNKETRTTRVRIELPNPDSVLLPDMYADVEIATGSGKPIIAVSDNAVIDTGTRQIVIIDKGEGRFEPREVKLGVRGNGFVEIREGLADGEKVVTSANFLIDAESNLKAALQGMATGPTPRQEKPQ
ncbi:MAG: Copper/silver efflux RND transporter, membrane fusion protein CusB [Pseudolabrys sp.]|jgi:Cu(I)/Ag(I) efflux system membrane fusion protein|nr:Copper/silver efflux RND transporter, membrane fusion protein CusB [Pseudolabrys sp.]